MKKIKNGRKVVYATNAIDPATTVNVTWGCVVPGKGGATLNSTIDPHAFNEELKDLAKDDYEPEHERYLHDGITI